MQEKIMVNQKFIKRCLTGGLKPYSIAKKQNIPVGVVERIRDGKNVPWFQRRPRIDKEGMCECCGVRKKEGRKLCYRCWKENAGCVGDDETDCTSSNSVYMVNHAIRS
jgi:hypothetical protein